MLYQGKSTLCTCTAPSLGSLRRVGPWRLAILIPKYPPFHSYNNDPSHIPTYNNADGVDGGEKEGDDLEEDGGGIREDLGCGAWCGVVWGVDQCGGGHSK